MADPVTFAILGAGSRGLNSYGKILAANPHIGRVVAVAEPRAEVRALAATTHNIPANLQFENWQLLLAKPKLADAVIIATQDSDHVGPAVAALKLGYAVLLEKPMAPNEADCRKIAEAAKQCAAPLAVCHVLRYTPYFRKMRQIIADGELGRVIGIQHTEEIAYWHFAHSYVRGNWRNEALSSSSLLAKCCHDMDILLYISGKRCRRVSSFGSLAHFRPEHAPPGAAQRCCDCRYKDQGCAYSAELYYHGKLKNGELAWPLNVITRDLSTSGIDHALRTGPYGRCVYASDNDVVDHQVVNLELEDNCLISFTMSAFTEKSRRLTSVMGSEGQLVGDGSDLYVTRFDRAGTVKHSFTDVGATLADGHLGGDTGIVTDFAHAVRAGNCADIQSSAGTSLMSHLIVFAAERARKNGTVELINLNAAVGSAKE